MAELHRIIERDGRQGALDLGFERKLVDIAADYMANEDQAVSFLYSGFTHVGLPHKKLANDAAWQVKTDRATMLVEPGRKTSKDGDPTYVGVPYGSKARLILLYLQTEAAKTNNREVELGRSLRDWLKRMGIPQGGKSIADVREQAERISRCRMTFEFQAGNTSGLINQNIVDTAMFFDDSVVGAKSFVERVKLSEMFFNQLMKHPVPIEEAAIRELNGHSQALDIYCWLAYRLHVLNTPTPISWVALKAQFGTGVSQMKHFKAIFLDNLKLALTVYPAAEAIQTKTGLTLHPSPSPIQPRLHGLRAPLKLIKPGD